MVNRLIQAMIAIVIGLALLPVVADFATGLTEVGGALEDAAVAPLVDLIPVMYVIILVAGTAGFIYTARR